MAEGVEFQINPDPGYFCHQCSKQVIPFLSSELVCPDCSSDFLEEMGHFLKSGIPDESNEFEVPHFEVPHFEDPPEEDLLADLLTHQRLFRHWLGESDIGRSLNSEVNGSERETQQQEEPEDEHSFFDSILPVSSDYNYEQADEAHLLRMRFFDDFSGDSEVDALASQLLDEVEISGPPPLSKDQIKSLPVVILNEIHISTELQCTVCMNDFKGGEKAKKLTCEHLFHEKCITPWLERQASCPNCRRTVKVAKKNSKSKRSLSCPRTLSVPRSSHSSRGLSDVSSLGEFFTASMNVNPFRFL